MQIRLIVKREIDALDIQGFQGLHEATVSQARQTTQAVVRRGRPCVRLAAL
jgi:hypothetical protein